MEKMPFQDGEPNMGSSTTFSTTTVATSEWRSGLPLLAGSNFSLRELQPSDAAPLLAMLTTAEVTRFISPPPTTLDGFERFISWTHRERQNGNYLCFAVVPHGMVTAIGIFQVRSLDAGSATAEWGFAIGSAFWGTGVFAEAASLVLNFAFDTIGLDRIEARACVANRRGNGALRKIGAVQEGVLRRSFKHNGRYSDQALWSILRDDWRTRLTPQSLTIH